MTQRIPKLSVEQGDTRILTNMDNAILAVVGTTGPHPGMIIPFGLLLLAIAVMPFANHHWGRSSSEL